MDGLPQWEKQQAQKRSCCASLGSVYTLAQTDLYSKRQKAAGPEAWQKQRNGTTMGRMNFPGYNLEGYL